jgi:site-specific DNA-methyltransferase (adenine-specific)
MTYRISIAETMSFEKVIIGGATLYRGDCRDVLPTLGKFDLLLTDPPYGLGDKMRGGTKLFSTGEGGMNSLGDWDAAPLADFVPLISGTADKQMIWGGNYYDMPASRGWLVWRKLNSLNTMASVELCWTNIDMNSKHFDHACGGFMRSHPTQKPLPLILWCLERSGNTKTVLDPFMGSGTTGVACAQSGRAFTGIEREQKYFDIACRRIEQAYAQGQLFEPQPATPQQEQIQL